MTAKYFKVRKGLTVDGSADVSGTVTANSIVAPVTGNVTGDVTGTVSSLSNHTTSDLAEGTNKYYTDARVDARITNTKVLTTIGYTPEDSANKGQPNGYASLDSSGLVPSSQLPSYVDDVLEYANLAAISAGTGTSGKIYVAQDTGKIYRWSGSAYVEISASPGSTDSVTEGSTNLYFTTSRSRSSISASGDLSYNSSTGVISYTMPAISYTNLTDKPTLFSGAYADLTGKPSLFSGSYTDLTDKPTLFSGAYADLTGKPTIPSSTTDITEGTNLYYTDARARAAISAGTGISYNSTTGVITSTATGPSSTDALTEGTTNLYYTDARARAAHSAGTGVTYNSSTGAISIGQAVGTSSAVTFASAAVGTIKAYDGTNSINIVNSTGEAAFFGDISLGGRILGSGSKTIRTGPNRATTYSSISGATAEDIIMSGMGSAAVPVSGLLITNSGLAAASTAGRRQGILIRNYGGQEYNGNASTTPPQPYFMVEASRGTSAEPRALNNGQPMGSFVGFTNAGSDLGSSNTPYWTAENYPVAPAFGLRTFQNHRGPYGSGAAASSFTGTISGTTLTVTSTPLIANIQIGQEIKLGSGAAWSTATNAYQIIAQTSGTTGQTGTYTLNASPGTYSSSTAFYTCNTTLGSGFFMNLVPNDTVLTSTARVTSQIQPDFVQLRAQATNSTTNAFEFRSWATSNYGGTGSTFRQGTDVTYLGISATRAAFAVPVQFPSYTRTQAAAITGSAGQQISISDSTGSGQAVNGMMAFWDTTNSRWSYIMDNSAV